jgi:hypothetical protein
MSNNWLNKTYTYPNEMRPYYSKYPMEAYYTPNDSDLKYNTSTDIYDHISLNSDTNRYHTNMLFRMLVDYVVENDMGVQINDQDFVYLIDSSMKKSFYKFCQTYS